VALEWKHQADQVDWDELSVLYRIAPLGEKKPADLQVVYANSMFCCFVYEGDRLVGAGRALADGLDCSCICDVAVHPELQGQGVGRDVVARLVALSAGHKKIILYAVAGKEPFYRKLGFRRMLTAMGIFANTQQAIDHGQLERD
jgi:N-acetylglutamate synthase-like GNAT family acetyltransferase